MFETKKISTDRETKLVCVCERESERERESIDLFCHGQLGGNRGVGWKWHNKKFI